MKDKEMTGKYLQAFLDKKPQRECDELNKKTGDDRYCLITCCEDGVNEFEKPVLRCLTNEELWDLSDKVNSLWAGRDEEREDLTKITFLSNKAYDLLDSLKEFSTHDKESILVELINFYVQRECGSDDFKLENLKNEIADLYEGDFYEDYVRHARERKND